MKPTQLIWVSDSLYKHPSRHRQGQYGWLVADQTGKYMLCVDGCMISCSQRWADKTYRAEICPQKRSPPLMICERCDARVSQVVQYDVWWLCGVCYKYASKRDWAMQPRERIGNENNEDGRNTGKADADG